jgi:hypothetical protein
MGRWCKSRNEVTDVLGEAFGFDFARRRMTLDAIKKSQQPQNHPDSRWQRKAGPDRQNPEGILSCKLCVQFAYSAHFLLR